VSSDRVGMSEIANHVGVTLAAVSNWRRRHPSFPPAEKSDGRELFSVGQVSHWLDGRKISMKNLRPGELPGSTYGARFRRAMGTVDPSGEIIAVDLWQQLIPLGGIEDMAIFADLVLGLLYLAVSDKRRWSDIMAAKGLRRLQLVELASLEQVPTLSDLHRARGVFLSNPSGETRTTEIIELVDRMRQSGRAPEVFEFLLDRFAEFEGRRGADVHTPSAIIRLVVELAAPAPGDTILDPCCGSGGFLVGAAEYVTSHGGHAVDASFTGHALSERSASLARMNLRLHHVPAAVDARASMIFDNGILVGDERFTIAMSNPPFDMKGPARTPLMSDSFSGKDSLARKRSSYAWLEYVVSAMADNGRAAVVMPGGALFREGAEKRIRAQMIEGGIVEAVVALPPGLFASTGIPVTVWLLGRPVNPHERDILLIDARGLGHMISRAQRSLSAEDRSRIVDTVMRWRTRRGYEDALGFSASVAVPRIRDQDYVLTPGRYVGTSMSSETPPNSVRELRDELARLGRQAVDLDEELNRKLDRTYAWIP
jgi:type I restriction enzyme M protein